MKSWVPQAGSSAGPVQDHRAEAHTLPKGRGQHRASTSVFTDPMATCTEEHNQERLPAQSVRLQRQCHTHADFRSLLEEQ